MVWSSCILSPLHTQSHWSSGSTVCFRSRGSVVHVRGMHPLSLWNQVSPVSDVSLHWWPRCDRWSPAMIGPLTLATGCFSNSSCPSSILTAGHRLLRHTPRIPYGPEPLLGGSPMELLHSDTTTQSRWSSGSTVRFLSRGSAVRVPGMHPLSQWNRLSPVSDVALQWPY